MKRIGNLFEQIVDIDNLRLADKKARRNKAYTNEIREHDKHAEEDLQAIRQSLIDGTFKTSEYFFFKVFEPKERDIARLPYYPDRIVHHALLNVLEPIWKSLFTADTYSCIKGRGIHLCAKRLRRAMRRDPEGTRYCLKIDIRKFYPSTKHDVLKRVLRRKIKDERVLAILDEIIDSVKDPGVPIGNYPSQYFENVLLSYLDHWIKESLKVKYYFRYADDMVFLSGSKEELRHILDEVREYLSSKLQLEIKPNFQIFPVEARGIDFVGYVFRHAYTRLRKSVKQRLARKVSRLIHAKSVLTVTDINIALAPWWGWAKYCNSINLIKTLRDEILFKRPSVNLC